MCSDNHSVLLLLNAAKKELMKCEEESKKAKEGKKVLLEEVRLFEASSRSHRVEMNESKSGLEDTVFTYSF